MTTDKVKTAKVMATFNDAFNKGALLVVEAGAKQASLIVQMIEIAYNGDLFRAEDVTDYTMNRGKFSEGKEKAAFRRKFCTEHSQHYKALTLARDEKDGDGNKLKSHALVAVTGKGRMRMSDVRKGISAIEGMANTLIRALSGLSNVKDVERVHVRRDGSLGVTRKGGDQDAMSAAELSRKAPTPTVEKRGKAEDAAKALSIAPLAVALSSKLAALDSVNDLDKASREELQTLMAVMIGLNIPAMDDAGNARPVTVGEAKAA